jgi:hypothetical protein
MLQQPCVLENVFAVTGGGIDLMTDGLSRVRGVHAWIIIPTMVEGKSFGDVYNGNHFCGKYVGKNFAMVNHIRDLRNTKVKELMQQLSAAADPNEENVLTDGPLTMPKRELFDNLPAIITINVKTMSSMVAEVNVLPDWRLKGVLKLEITKTNLDLLLEQPSAATAPWTPTTEQPDVCWRAYSKSVYCSYWDSRKSKQRLKSMSVDMSSEMEHEDKLDAVNRAACEIQAFYESHHNQTGNMPKKRGRESDDDDDVSAAQSDAAESFDDRR